METELAIAIGKKIGIPSHILAEVTWKTNDEIGIENPLIEALIEPFNGSFRMLCGAVTKMKEQFHALEEKAPTLQKYYNDWTQSLIRNLEEARERLKNFEQITLPMTQAGSDVSNRRANSAADLTVHFEIMRQRQSDLEAEQMRLQRNNQILESDCNRWKKVAEEQALQLKLVPERLNDRFRMEREKLVSSHEKKLAALQRECARLLESGLQENEKKMKAITKQHEEELKKISLTCDERIKSCHQAQKDAARNHEEQVKTLRLEHVEAIKSICDDHEKQVELLEAQVSEFEKMVSEMKVRSDDMLKREQQFDRVLAELRSECKMLLDENSLLRRASRAKTLENARLRKSTVKSKHITNLTIARKEKIQKTIIEERDPAEREWLSKWKKRLGEIATNLPLLYRILSHMNTSGDSVHAKGIHWPDNVKALTIYLSGMGEYWYTVVSHLLGLPCFRTVQRYIKDEMEFRGVNYNLFDGSTASIAHLKEMFSPDKDLEVVLAIDACSATPSVRVSKTGLVTGLLHDRQLSQEEYELIRQSVHEFQRMLKDVKDEIIRYHFVVLALPLDPNIKPFPVFVSRNTSGTADAACDQAFSQLFERMNEVGLNVLGVAFDGDRTWLKFVRLITKELYGFFALQPPYNLDLPLAGLNLNVPRLVFEDPLHLLKCFRYRICCGARVCPWPDNHDTTVVAETLAEKLEIPRWIITDDHNKKMEDSLPLSLFRRQYLLEAVDRHEYDLFLVLLPGVLLKLAIFSSNQTKNSCTSVLSLLFALLVYYKESRTMDNAQTETKSGKPKGRKKQDADPDEPEESNRKEKSPHMALMDEDTVDKMLALCWSICQVLKRDGVILLGRLGTHILEHYFGLIRRMCMKDDSSISFERSMTKGVLLNLISEEYGFKVQIQPKRSSDSGATIYSNEDPATTAMDACSLKQAFVLMADIIHLCGRHIPEHCVAKVEEWRAELELPSGTFHHFFGMVPEELIYTVRTTTQAGMNISSGKLGIRRLVAGQELTNAINM